MNAGRFQTHMEIIDLLNVLTKLLQQLFLWIYRLPVKGLALCCVFAAMICRSLYHEYGKKTWWRPAVALLLLLWMIVVVWVTILSRETNAVGHFQIIPFHTLRNVLAGGSGGNLRSALMNVLLFVPGGLLCAWAQPNLRKSGWRMLGAALLFGGFSLIIELAQFHFQLGHGEIDDVLTNTLGAAAGIFLVCWSEKYPTQQTQ